MWVCVRRRKRGRKRQWIGAAVDTERFYWARLFLAVGTVVIGHGNMCSSFISVSSRFRWSAPPIQGKSELELVNWNHQNHMLVNQPPLASREVLQKMWHIKWFRWFRTCSYSSIWWLTCSCWLSVFEKPLPRTVPVTAQQKQHWTHAIISPHDRHVPPPQLIELLLNFLMPFWSFLVHRFPLFDSSLYSVWSIFQTRYFQWWF